MKTRAVRAEVPEGANIILGQTHFIKTAEDLYEAVSTSAPGARFGVAFAEASQDCLIRSEGNDQGLVEACERNLRAIGAGHVFCILLKGAFPISVMRAVKGCEEVCTVFCATANPLEVLVAETEQGAGVVGVIDGFPPRGVEGEQDRAKRKEFLRKIGYKL